METTAAPATRAMSPALIIVLGTLTAFGPLSIDMYLPGLPTIGQDLGADAGAVGLTLSLFFVGLAVGQIFYGPLSDRLGRRRPLLFGCALYTVASVGCALAPSIGALIGFRLLQALGGCAGMVIARSVVRDRFEQRDAAKVFSWLMLVMGLAPITAPLIGGQLLLVWSWRAIFWVLAGFGLLCVALVVLALPESLAEERRTRAGLAQTLQVYAGLLGSRAFVGYALAGGLVAGAMFAYITGSPFVIIELYAVSPQHYGWIFGANALGLIAASQVNRRLLTRFSGDGIIETVLLLATLASLALVLAAATGFGGLPGLLVPLFFSIMANGLVGPNATAAALAPHGRTAGSASALLGALQFAIGAASGALVSALHAESALPMASVIMICLVGALAAAFLLVPRRVVSAH